VASFSNCFHTFVIVFMVNTAQGAKNTCMFAVDAYEQQISKAMIRRRGLRAAPNQGIQYV